MDVAQDYALKVLHDEGLFDLGLTFKGGTALRKYRAGNLGRFSTDLDFAAVDPDLGEVVFGALDGVGFHDVRFEVEEVTPQRRANLRVLTPLGDPEVDARVEVVPRPPWQPPEMLDPVEFPVHGGYEFMPVPLPVVTLDETIAEKLAAYRRRALLRDLYDLWWFTQQGAFDEALIRRLTYLKVYVDVVEEGIADGPFDAERDLFALVPADFPPEAIGLLSGTPETETWLKRVNERFRFLADTTEEEAQLQLCDPRDSYEVSQLINTLDD
ncbi:MAG TPA: nucleotidyl transferase AbiEii/AbiGii toxin family protein [Acidimicrobiia bacterium]|nr:nucleotidyl transferase AbiEii/AbiGii toxin family protein [Acidimicrobiia bacterium]